MATESQRTSSIRVPAEWEPQSAVWIQWPGKYEVKLRPAFTRIITTVKRYQPVHLLTSTQAEKESAQQFLQEYNVDAQNIHWHIIPVDNAWMRDNGPIYVTDGTATWIQNWKFTGWDGSIRWVTVKHDNLVPDKVAQLLEIKSETFNDYILEKGNLEVNGQGVAMLNWDCQDQRNPGMTKAQHEAILKERLGLKTIIWSYGHYKSDLTTGHIDGKARFISENTVVVTEMMRKVGDDFIEKLYNAGLRVKWYPGDVNWLVGNGFVVAMEGRGRRHNEKLKNLLKEYFPNRDIHLVKAHAINRAGGGIHCVTNDQPVLIKKR